jgi:hypothetical protein
VGGIAYIGNVINDTKYKTYIADSSFGELIINNNIFEMAQ